MAVSVFWAETSYQGSRVQIPPTLLKMFFTKNEAMEKLAIKKEALSFSEIKRLFPDEWVLIGNPDLDETPVLKAVVDKLRSGVVLFHSKTKMDVALHAKEVKSGYDNFVCVYTGEIPKHKRYWLSNW